MLRAAREEGISLVQSWKNESGNKDLGGLDREVVACRAYTTQFKVNSSDQVDYTCSHSQAHVRRYPKVLAD